MVHPHVQYVEKVLDNRLICVYLLLIMGYNKRSRYILIAIDR